MFGERRTIDCQPRWKNAQPAHSTTGVLNTNCTQRDTSPSIQCRAAGKMCAIANATTGIVNKAPTQNRNVLSRSSATCSVPLAEKFLGSNVIPQIGQLPG